MNDTKRVIPKVINYRPTPRDEEILADLMHRTGATNAAAVIRWALRASLPLAPQPYPPRIPRPLDSEG